MINRVLTYRRYNAFIVVAFRALSSLLAHRQMKQLGTSLLLLAMLGFSLPGYANTLAASVDRDTLAIHETFTLTLRYSGSSDDMPDFTPLRRDFEIVSTRNQKTAVSINFRRETYTDWMLVLAPKKSGVYTLPAITLDGVQSQPILITVKDQGTNQNVFVTVETDKISAYVQEQILLTVRLYTAIQLDDVALEPLELNNVVVVALDQKQFQTNHNGRPHIVVETVYALFPQTSGDLTVPSLSYNVLVSSGRQGIFNQMMGGQSNNLMRLRTEEVPLEIKPVPANHAGKAWLPANKLTLSEHWSHSRDSIKVGEPVTRSITIAAEGLTAGQIPPLNPAQIDGLTLYPDKAQTDEQKSAQGVNGTRIETFAIVPNRAGKFTLPEVTVDWWDGANNKMQTARLPATEIEVSENPFAISAPQEAADLPAPQSQPTTTPDTPIPAPSLMPVAPIWLITLAAVALLLALVMSFLYWRTRRELSAIHSMLMEDKTRQQQTDNNLWNELKRANAAQDYVALRKAVLAWAQNHWQENTLQSLQSVAERTDNQALREQLTQLDRALYSNGKSEPWDSGELLQQIYACRKQKREQRRAEEGLKPLYKS